MPDKTNRNFNRVLSRLLPLLEGDEPGLVALSGGMDSSILLAALVRAGRPVIAATFASPLHHPQELERAARLCRLLEVEHLVLEEDPFEDQTFSANPVDRCYWCKKRRLARLKELAAGRNIELIYDGSLASDSTAYRPGKKALDEAGAARPMVEAGMDKADVAALARGFGLEDWLQPASACLASRIEYGRALSADLIDRVGRAEDALSRELKLRPGSFRLRVHGPLARLEIDPTAWTSLLEPESRQRIIELLTGLDFKYVTLDLAGFHSGSMDKLHLD